MQSLWKSKIGYNKVRRIVMKIIGIILTLLCFVGCVTTPHPDPPDSIYMYNEIKAGRMTAEGVNKTWDDYRAKIELWDEAVERSVVGPILVGAIMTTVSAAATPVAYGSYYSGGKLYPGKAVINTVPTAGGGSSSTIKWYP
jgi:hypothetical protein